MVILTRRSPIFPFNLLNYASGVTCVSLKDYILASVDMIPGSIMYGYLGSLRGLMYFLIGGTPIGPYPPQAGAIKKAVSFLRLLTKFS